MKAISMRRPPVTTPPNYLLARCLSWANRCLACLRPFVRRRSRVVLYAEGPPVVGGGMQVLFFTHCCSLQTTPSSKPLSLPSPSGPVDARVWSLESSPFFVLGSAQRPAASSEPALVLWCADGLWYVIPCAVHHPPTRPRTKSYDQISPYQLGVAACAKRVAVLRVRTFSSSARRGWPSP